MQSADLILTQRLSAMMSLRAHGSCADPQTIILCVCEASLDPATHKAPALANAADPRGQRTFIILTKPDLVPLDTFWDHVRKTKGRFKSKIGLARPFLLSHLAYANAASYLRQSLPITDSVTSPYHHNTIELTRLAHLLDLNSTRVQTYVYELCLLLQYVS